MGSIHPAVSEICVPQSLDPICTKFDKFLGNGQAYMGQMGKWPWRCTTTGLDNSTELRMEKIHQAVTEIWVPQVWQPPTRPPARPPGLWRQYPSSPEGWGVKMSPGMSKEASSLNGPLCAYLMRQNLHDRTHPRSWGDKCPCQVWKWSVKNYGCESANGDFPCAKLEYAKKKLPNFFWATMKKPGTYVD